MVAAEGRLRSFVPAKDAGTQDDNGFSEWRCRHGRSQRSALPARCRSYAAIGLSGTRFSLAGIGWNARIVTRCPGASRL